MVALYHPTIKLPHRVLPKNTFLQVSVSLKKKNNKLITF